MTDAAARRPGWLLDERASAGRENLDVDHVARYDAKEAWDASAEVRLLESLGLDAGSTVLDLGAGTGQFTLAVAPRCARVIAADVSQPMLERLRSKVAEAGFDNVETVEAGFVSYEHKGAPVDVAYSRYALHHVPDFWKARALVRLARCMRPGGLLRVWDIVYSFAPEEADGRIDSGAHPSPKRAKKPTGCAPMSRSTSATSTPPSPGCSSHCSNAQASTSKPPTTPTTASSPSTSRVGARTRPRATPNRRSRDLGMPPPIRGEADMAILNSPTTRSTH